MNEKKFTRSNTQRMIGGVCGGLAEYLNIDVTIVRLLFALSFFLLYPGTIFIYLILLLVMPEKSSE